MTPRRPTVGSAGARFELGWEVALRAGPGRRNLRRRMGEREAHGVPFGAPIGHPHTLAQGNGEGRDDRGCNARFHPRSKDHVLACQAVLLRSRLPRRQPTRRHRHSERGGQSDTCTTLTRSGRVGPRFNLGCEALRGEPVRCHEGPGPATAAAGSQDAFGAANRCAARTARSGCVRATVRPPPWCAPIRCESSQSVAASGARHCRGCPGGDARPPSAGR